MMFNSYMNNNEKNPNLNLTTMQSPSVHLSNNMNMTKNHPILFRKRIEKIDWKRLVSVDVNRVANHVDVDTLQELLSPITFCDITNEIDTRYIDTNFVKLFQLAQLLIEYLLYSQDYLTSTITSLKGENENLQKNNSKLKEQLQEKINRLKIVRRECHRRRLLLLAQQQLMDCGPQSYHRCLYCPKAFLNASFLSAHIHRRHPEAENINLSHFHNLKTQNEQPIPMTQLPQLSSLTSQQPQQQQQQKQQLEQTTPQPLPSQQQIQPLQQGQFDVKYDLIQTTNNNTSASLERDVRALLEQLKCATGLLPQPAMQHRCEQRSTSPIKSVGFDSLDQSHDFVDQGKHYMRESSKSPQKEITNPDWPVQLIEEHRKDMELLRETFVKELHALQIKHANTEEELARLKNRPVVSNLGDLENDPTTVIGNNQCVENTFEKVKMDNEKIQILNQTKAVQPIIPTYFDVGIDDTTKIQKINNKHNKLPIKLGSCSSLNLTESIKIDKKSNLNHNDSLWSLRTSSVHSHRLSEDDYDDRAEQDITASVENIDQPMKSISRRNEIESVGKIQLKNYRNNLFDKKNKSKFYHYHKHVRSAGIQVGGRRNSITKLYKLNEKISKNHKSNPSESIYVKIKRPHSQSGSSTGSSIKSHTIKTKRKYAQLNNLDLSREIVIVRTDDDEEENYFMNKFDKDQNDITHSIHLIPTAITGRYKDKINEFTDQIESIQLKHKPNRGVSQKSILMEKKPENRYIEQIVDNSSRNSFKSDSKLQSSHGSHNGEQIDSLDVLRNSPVIIKTLYSTMDENDKDVQQISQAMNRVLITSTATSPTPSLNGSTNILRSSRLLDHLRSDPDTLKRLRHEVEQLLLEQLTEHGIESEQNRLTTIQLNEKLAVLHRERENLSKKHPNFMEIRDALAQYVDRLAQAQLHGSNVNLPEMRLRSAQISKNQLGYKSGLPPPAGHSPGSARRAGTLPLSAQHFDVASPLGVSLPTLPGRNDALGSQSNVSGLIGSRNKKENELINAKPRLQRSSPQLRYISEEKNSLVTGEKNYTHSRLSSSSSIIDENLVQKHQAHVTKSSTHSIRPVTSNSPPAQFSHDQRVVTFGNSTLPTESNLMNAQSSDEWDSDTEDLNAIAAQFNSTNRPSINTTNPSGKFSELDSDIMDQMISDLERFQPSQQNNNSTNPIQSNSRQHSIRVSLFKPQNSKTDDEDICSVSSINDALPEDNSLLLIQNSQTKQRNPVNVSRSLDRNIANVHAHSATIGPRPVTRFGDTSKNSLTNRNISVESPETSNTMPTSLWGTYSKGPNPDTNVLTIGKSDGQLDELDSDY